MINSTYFPAIRLKDICEGFCVSLERMTTMMDLDKGNCFARTGSGAFIGELLNNSPVATVV